MVRCPHCKEEYNPSEIRSLLSDFGLDEEGTGDLGTVLCWYCENGFIIVRHVEVYFNFKAEGQA